MDESCVSLLMRGARTALRQTEPYCFVLVQQDAAGTGFAKTLHLESRQLMTCVVNVPLDHPRAGQWVVAEAKAMTGFCEVRYDRSGRRTVPILRPLPIAAPGENLPVGQQDVLLVTGGDDITQ